MSTTLDASLEPAQAVIISGQRKGQFITVTNADAMGPEAEAILDSLVSSANRLVDNARAAADEARTLRDELRRQRGA